MWSVLNFTSIFTESMKMNVWINHSVRFVQWINWSSSENQFEWFVHGSDWLIWLNQ